MLILTDLNIRKEQDMVISKDFCMKSPNITFAINGKYIREIEYRAWSKVDKFIVVPICI